MGHLAYENVTSSLQKNYLKQQQQATSLPPNQKKIAKLDFHPFLWVWGRGIAGAFPEKCQSTEPIKSS